MHLDLKFPYSAAGLSDTVPITSELRRAIPVTLSLLVGGAVIWLSVAIPLGLISAVYAGSLLDRALLFFVLLGISAHPIVIGLFLRQTLGYELGLAPIEGLERTVRPRLVRRGRLGAPHAVAVDHPQRPLRRVVFPDDPRPRDQ